MIFVLLDWLAPLLEPFEFGSHGESRVFITARAALAAMTSFLLAVGLGPFAIRLLRARFRERIASGSDRLNELHRAKNDTPTMGGLFILAAVLVSTLIWGNLRQPLVQIALVVAVGSGLIGGWDDWIKQSSTRNGLSVRQKLLLQVVLAMLVGMLLDAYLRRVPCGRDLQIPLAGVQIPLGAAFIVWALLVLVGSSNAVNLTDGLDGLAAGCMVFAGAAFVALAYLAGHRVLAEHMHVVYVPGAGEVCIVLAATVGALLGFLWYNGHPAEVFMGDVGSLPLGALIGYAGLVTRQEPLLVLIGGVFVVETLSVIAQVGWFRLTRRRLLACSPLHNHFLFRGHHEMKIVVRFWITAALLAILGVAMLKLRT